MAGRGERPSNFALEQTAGSHALAAAAQRERSADSVGGVIEVGY